MPEFYIKGLKEIQRAFEELPKNVARKVIRQNLRKSMKPMQSRVDADAPVGETGSLKEAKLLAGKKKRGVISMNVALVLDSTSTVPYHAAFVEYGTSKQGPSGFMRRAFDSQQAATLQIAMDGITAGIDAEVKALAVG